MNFWKSKQGELKDAIVDRASGLSIVAILMTAMFGLFFLFYLFLNAVFGGQVDAADLIIMVLIPLTMIPLWFAEGQRYGAKRPNFIVLKKHYNDKADKIVEMQKIQKLEEFCEHDFEQRKKMYIEKRLGAVGLDAMHLELVKSLPIEQFDRKFELKIKVKVGEVEKDKLLNNLQKRTLKALIFKPCPVKPTSLATVMSGISTESTREIQDMSGRNKNVMMAVVFARMVLTFLAMSFIAFQFADGISFATFTRAFMFLTAFVTTVGTSFLCGERNVSKDKTHFYRKLTDFIYRFFEWAQIPNEPMPAPVETPQQPQNQD